MAEEHRCQAPQLCANNCGFFGSPATQNLCSKCYRDIQLKEQQSSSAKQALNQSLVPSSSSSSSLPSLSSISSSFSVSLAAKEKSLAETKEDVKVAEVQAQVQVRPNRCLTCKKRVGRVNLGQYGCVASSLVPLGRGLKRKIGCIEVITQIGRKKKMEDDYVKGDTIGQGKFGSVWLCRSRTSRVEFACKTLRKGEETVHREVEIMQHLSGHPGVVTLQAVYEEPDCFHLVMELCSGGRLIDQMAEGHYSEQRAANIFKDVMLVIKYCHEMGVVHRDVKPENILLTTSGKIKLADFGLAMRISNGQTLSGLAGSPAYVAPEVLLGNYSEKVDIWSAGVLLHALLVGFLPFQGESLTEVFEAIKNVKLDFHSGIWESVSKPARDLLARMLTRDVSSRITADEVLRHPWLLFYTERSLKTLSIKSKSKNKVGHSIQMFNSHGSELSTRRIHDGSHRQGPQPVLTSNSSSCKSEEQDENGVVDALAVAISHVRISEPKRSRLCSPTGPMEQQCSSNLTANNLCRAF